MRLNSLHLCNYRRHRDLTLDLGPGFNVLVGINGCGKTSILTAISQVLQVPMLGIDTNLPEEVIRLEVHRQNGRVSFALQFPFIVQCKAGQSEFSRFKNSAAEPFGMMGKPSVPWINEAGKRPIGAFYRSTRSWTEKPQGILETVTVKQTREAGYKNWDNASASAGDLQMWAIAKCLERFQVSSETGVRFDEIVGDELALVNQALARAVDDVRGLRYDLKEKSLLVERANGEIPFSYLSDGQQAVIGLVSDIARRMCLLNPMLGQKVIEETEGTVLIDELDLHLHPDWQRSLTSGLKSAFPKVQFIVSSHSPQVLGELKPEEIILLRPEGGEHPQVSYGLDASSVLEIIMSTPPRVDKIDSALGELFRTLEGADLEAAGRLLEDLRHKAPGLPELLRAEALLKRKQVLGR